MDDKLKQRILVAVLVFNLVLIFYQLFFNGFLFGDFTILKLIIGFVVAAVAGGASYVAVQASQK